MAMTNQEMNKLFNVRSIRDVIKRVDLGTDVLKTGNPIFGMARENIPPDSLGTLPCIICVGPIHFDRRHGYQERCCQNCGNVFRIRRGSTGKFKYRWAPDLEVSPERRF